MKIVNSIMPMSDIEALAANGQKLRVAVTKTSAQGKSAQSATPNLMSFSTDENSIWFNGKKYGVYILKGFENLSTDSNTGVIQSFLGDFTYDRWVDAVNTGNIVFVEANNTLTPASVYANNSKDLNIMFVTLTYTYVVSIHYSTGSGYSIDLIQQDSLVRVADVNNTLTNSSTDTPLSAAMGKKLQDEKLAKTDVVNNLTTTDTSKALSAAQGKALNDRISGLGNVYRVKGTKNTIEGVYDISADARLGDVWNITSAFTIGGKPYPANTNIVCIAEWSTSTTPQNNWDPLGGTVDLSTYLSKKDASSTYATKSELSSHTGNKNNPHGVTKSQIGLGNVTNDAQVKKTDIADYNLAVKAPSASQVPSTEAFAKTANYAEMFPVSFDATEAGEKTIVSSSTTTAGGTIVWLSDMKKFAYKGTDGKYYNNWAISGSPNLALVNAGLVKQGDNSPIPGKVYIHDSGVYFSTGTGLVLAASKDSSIIIE